MANLITSCRILLSLLLLFFPALSPGFYGLYLAAGSAICWTASWPAGSTA